MANISGSTATLEAEGAQTFRLEPAHAGLSLAPGPALPTTLQWQQRASEAAALHPVTTFIQLQSGMQEAAQGRAETHAGMAQAAVTGMSAAQLQPGLSDSQSVMPSTAYETAPVLQPQQPSICSAGAHQATPMAPNLALGAAGPGGTSSEHVLQQQQQGQQQLLGVTPAFGGVVMPHGQHHQAAAVKDLEQTLGKTPGDSVDARAAYLQWSSNQQVGRPRLQHA